MGSTLTRVPRTQDGSTQTIIGNGQAVADSLNTLAGQISTLQSQVTQQYDTLTDPDKRRCGQRRQPDRPAQQPDRPGPSRRDQRERPRGSTRQRDRRPLPVLERHTTTETNGMVNVSFGNAATAAQNGTTDATPLVNGDTVNLSAQPDRHEPERLRAGRSVRCSASTTRTPPAGARRAARQLHARLNGVANQLVTTVNSAISDADPQPARPRRLLHPSGTTAATISVNPRCRQRHEPAVHRG